jgi:hypothetical protein
VIVIRARPFGLAAKKEPQGIESKASINAKRFQLFSTLNPWVKYESDQFAFDGGALDGWV